MKKTRFSIIALLLCFILALGQAQAEESPAQRVEIAGTEYGFTLPSGWAVEAIGDDPARALAIASCKDPPLQLFVWLNERAGWRLQDWKEALIKSSQRSSVLSDSFEEILIAQRAFVSYRMENEEYRTLMYATELSDGIFVTFEFRSTGEESFSDNQRIQEIPASLCTAATGLVTPETPSNPEIRKAFCAWAEETLVPYLKRNVQDKWSAERCREVADKLEAAGFRIADKWKDKLYRTQREHRLYASEALGYLVSSQFGDYWEWTVEDKAWLDDLRVAVGAQPEKHCYAPSASDGTTSQIIEQARDAVCSQYGVTREQWQSYDICVDFLSGGTLDGGTQYAWSVPVMSGWNGDYLFAYYFCPATGEVELNDIRNRIPIKQ